MKDEKKDKYFEDMRYSILSQMGEMLEYNLLGETEKGLALRKAWFLNGCFFSSALLYQIRSWVILHSV